MSSHSRALPDLFACFRGTVPQHADWMALLGLANQTLTTPALIEMTERSTDHIPADVRRYVRDMFETITGRKAKVELLESVRSGGKACRFRVDMLT
jgi:hypothetical protein